MRVLYVVSLFPCWSETFIVREIKGLLAGGADVRILSLKPPSEKLVQADAEALLDRVRHPYPPAEAAVHRVKNFAKHSYAITRASGRIAARLAHQPKEVAKSLEAVGRGVEQLEWIKEFDPDVIHAHWGTYPSTVAWALSRILEKPFGFTCHAHDIFVNDHLLKEKIESARVGVTISQFNVDYLAEKVTPRARERLKIVHCGVELGATPYKREGRARSLIVAVGRLDPIKGFDVLIDALGMLKRDGKEFHLRLIGQGPLEGMLKESVARQGLGANVDFVGALPQAEVRAALYEAAFFTLPSVVTPTGDRDGIPVSLMEAMAAGTPVVSTRVSGIPELVIDGETGLVVNERDPRALATAMGRLLDAAEGEALGERLAKAARAKVEAEFDASKEAEKMRKLFSDACA